MWYENRTVISKELPELHTHHKSAKIYKNWNAVYDQNDWGPPPSFSAPTDVEVTTEYSWYCALCFAEGVDVHTVRYVKK